MNEQIEIKLDFLNKRPIAEQIKEEVRLLIKNGVLQPGDRLPTVRSLAAQLRVNFNTVARVYRVLDQERLISTQQGRGSYVLENAYASMPANAPTHKERVEQLIADLFENANRMHISKKELQTALIRRIQQQRRRPGLSHRKKRLAQKKVAVTSPSIRDVRKANSIRKFLKHRKS